MNSVKVIVVNFTFWKEIINCKSSKSRGLKIIHNLFKYDK